MRTKIRKWGNSLALRIPKIFVEELDIGDDSSINLTLSEGKIVIAPLKRKKKCSLKKLLAGITGKNLHEEVDSGEPEGREIW